MNKDADKSTTAEFLEKIKKLADELSIAVSRLLNNGFEGNINHYLRDIQVIRRFYKNCYEVEQALEKLTESLISLFRPRILIFSTDIISDAAIDLTGLMHKHYCPTTCIIRVPCSSMIRPDLILYAFYCGFDGVFIAADGTDCPYLDDCLEKTARNVQKAYELLKKAGIEPERLKMSGICSVCIEPFVKSVNEFADRLKRLGPIGIKIPALVKVMQYE